MTVAIGDVVGGTYRVLRELGSGGMGRVFEAEDVGLGRRVALKVATAEGEVARSRLLREARAAARLRSPHVARVFRADLLSDGSPYVVSELLEGEALDAVLARDGALPPDSAVTLFAGALEGLAEAHACGLVHRDVKPANLFLVRGAEPALKMLDFGFVSDTASETQGLTRTSEAVGTSHYMAPEQRAGGRDVDARADVWSAGVTLYELLTGRRPPDASTIPALIRARGDVPTPLDAVIARCLEVDPARRFPDAASLRAALLAPVGTSPRRRGAPRPRRPWVALVAIAVATFLLGGAALALFVARPPSKAPLVPSASVAPARVVAEVLDASPEVPRTEVRVTRPSRPVAPKAPPASTPRLPKCHCVSGGGYLCRAFVAPWCSCWSLEGTFYCPVPVPAGQTCPTPTVPLPISSHNAPCTAYARDGSTRPGKYRCSDCDDEYGAGRTDDPCEGADPYTRAPTKGALHCYE